jgi:adenylate cyclase
MKSSAGPPPLEVEKERLNHFKDVIHAIANKMAIPLFLIFWVADLLYFPEFKWTFLSIRLIAVPICLVTNLLVDRCRSIAQASILARLYAIALAGCINAIIFLIPHQHTSYYAGLNLVCIGAAFIPLRFWQSITVVVGIYAPFYAIELTRITEPVELGRLLVDSFFIVSTSAMCLLIQYFHNSLRDAEIEAKGSLLRNIQTQEEEIRRKTDEAVRLNALSSQFSPQVIGAIKDGTLSIEGSGTRARICAIFVDIVDSTERIGALDKDKVDKVISKFLDESIETFLKYDITVDKFLGDGLMGFCNAPLRRSDYVERTLQAALELREKVNLLEPFFERHWRRRLEIRVGIADGFANVGFYGNKKYFRSYSAIGSVMNLASRLCSSAQPGQIIVDSDLAEHHAGTFEFVSQGKKSLKGFEKDVIYTFSLTKQRDSASESMTCSDCGKSMVMISNDLGHLEFSCPACQANSSRAA